MAKECNTVVDEHSCDIIGQTLVAPPCGRIIHEIDLKGDLPHRCSLHFKHQDDETMEESISLHKALKLFLNSLQYSFLFYKRNSNCFFKGFCWFLLILTWIKILITFTIYAGEELRSDSLLYKVIMHIWYTQTGIKVTLLLTKFRTGMLSTITTWNRYHTVYGGLCMADVQQLTKRFFIAYWIIVPVFLVSITVLLATTLKQSTILLLSSIPTLFDDKSNYVILVYHSLISLFLGNAYMTSVIWLLLICCLLSKEFKYLTNQMQQALNNGTLANGNLEYWRQRHWFLCMIIKKFDSMASLGIMATYLFDLPLVGLNIYFMVMADQSLLSNESLIPLFSHVISLFLSGLHMTLVTSAALLITSQVMPTIIYYL